MLEHEALAQSEDKRHSEQLEAAMVVLATALLRKTGRRRVMLTQQDIEDAANKGLAEARPAKDDPNAIIYELPKKA